MQPAYPAQVIGNLKTTLFTNLSECQINLDQKEFNKYIDDLNTPSPGKTQSDISDENYEKIGKLIIFNDYLKEVNEAIKYNCETKQNLTIVTSLITNSIAKPVVSDFMNYIVNKEYDDLKILLDHLAQYHYIPSINDTLGISQDNFDKLFNENTYSLAGKFAYLIDFVKDTENSNKYQNGKKKKDLQSSLDLISTAIDTVIKQNNSQKLTIKNLNDLYDDLKDKLNEDLKNVYDIKDTNGQPITNFYQVQHKFEYLSSEITDNPA